MLKQIEKIISKFGNYFQSNFFKLLAVEASLEEREKRAKFSTCFMDLN